MKAKKYKYDKAAFIAKSREIHGDKYDYSEVEFKNTKHKVKIKCSCGHVWECFPNQHWSGSGCKKCGSKDRPQNQAKSHDVFVQEARCIHGDRFEYLSVYEGAMKMMQMKCNTCMTVFEQRPSSHLEGRGCKICQYKLLPQNQSMEIEEFEARCHAVHDGKYLYRQDYKGVRHKVTVVCPKHGEFNQEASAHLLHGQGCPTCKESKGEAKIAAWLKKHKIKFKRQKTFDGCRNKHLLKFDFYLLDSNVCIEYDGEQHFYPTAFFGKRDFKATQRNDAVKTRFCQKNDIKLVRIPFFEYNRLDEILENTCLKKSFPEGKQVPILLDS